MSEVNTGGPAFQSVRKIGDVMLAEGGLTKREVFAGQAMAALITVTSPEELGESKSYEIMALAACEMADELLKALAK